LFIYTYLATNNGPNNCRLRKGRAVAVVAKQRTVVPTRGARTDGFVTRRVSAKGVIGASAVLCRDAKDSSARCPAGRRECYTVVTENFEVRMASVSVSPGRSTHAKAFSPEANKSEGETGQNVRGRSAMRQRGFRRIGTDWTVIPPLKESPPLPFGGFACRIRIPFPSGKRQGNFAKKRKPRRWVSPCDGGDDARSASPSQLTEVS
jgi:hypothetical protein